MRAYLYVTRLLQHPGRRSNDVGAYVDSSVPRTSPGHILTFDTVRFAATRRLGSRVTNLEIQETQVLLLRARKRTEPPGEIEEGRGR